MDVTSPGTETLERDARALQYRQGGLSYRQIAEAMGYPSARAAQQATQRAMLDAGPEDPEEARHIEAARLDYLTRKLMKVLSTDHFVTGADGRVSLHPITREPLTDDAPIIQAVHGLRMISESRRKLLGLDAAAKHEITIDSIDQKIRELEDQIAKASG